MNLVLTVCGQHLQGFLSNLCCLFESHTTALSAHAASQAVSHSHQTGSDINYLLIHPTLFHCTVYCSLGRIIFKLSFSELIQNQNHFNISCSNANIKPIVVLIVFLQIKSLLICWCTVVQFICRARLLIQFDKIKIHPNNRDPRFVIFWSIYCWSDHEWFLSLSLHHLTHHIQYQIINRLTLKRS